MDFEGQCGSATGKSGASPSWKGLASVSSIYLWFSCGISGLSRFSFLFSLFSYIGARNPSNSPRQPLPTSKSGFYSQLPILRDSCQMIAKSAVVIYVWKLKTRRNVMSLCRCIILRYDNELQQSPYTFSDCSTKPEREAKRWYHDISDESVITTIGGGSW